jgi:heavy metal sensor kinase
VPDIACGAERSETSTDMLVQPSGPLPKLTGRAFELLRRLARRFALFVHSLRFQLTVWFVAILGIVVAVFSAFIYSVQARELHSLALEQLTLKTRQLVTFYRISGLQFSPDGKLVVPTLANDSPFLQKGEILILVDPEGTVIFSQGPIDQSEADKLAAYGLQHGIEAGPFTYAVAEAASTGSLFQQEYYFALAPLPITETARAILILGSSSDPGGQLQRLVFTLLLGDVVTLLGAWLGGYWLAHRAMRPVQVITRTAREIGETDLNRRLHLNAHDELGELADTFDEMLARLQAAFDRQRQFTADASHELRTPLTIIGLETERVLAMQRPIEEYEGALRVIRSENEYMGRLVNDLLTLARMDAGQTVMRQDELDLSEVALDVIEHLAPIAKQSNVVLTSGALPEVRVQGDRQYLEQMIANLVDNGIKYASGPGKSVRVETGCQTSGAWLRVSDNGPGIAAEHLPHLFDRFYRVDEARSRQKDLADGGVRDATALSGSGLGLSIVKWVAQAHGGEVRVETELGKGSTFEVDLPSL